MSETDVNAYRLELADKEQQLNVLKGEITGLEKKIESLDPTPKKRKSPEAELVKQEKGNLKAEKSDQSDVQEHAKKEAPGPDTDKVAVLTSNKPKSGKK